MTLVKVTVVTGDNTTRWALHKEELHSFFWGMLAREGDSDSFGSTIFVSQVFRNIQAGLKETMTTSIAGASVQVDFEEVPAK